MSQATSPLGSRGLIIYDPQNANSTKKNEGYFFVPETDWRARPTSPPADAPAKSVLAELKPRQLFVDLDLLKGLADRTAAKTSAPATSAGKDEIFIKDDDKYYLAPSSTWQPLDDNLSRATAQVLVKRGTVVAAIPPNDIPVGAYCVLINIDSLK